MARDWKHEGEEEHKTLGDRKWPDALVVTQAGWEGCCRRPGRVKSDGKGSCCDLIPSMGVLKAWSSDQLRNLLEVHIPGPSTRGQGQVFWG